MTAVWAVKLALPQSLAAAGLRLQPGIEVCAQQDAVWLRGANLDEALEMLLRKLPGAERFSVLPDGQLLAAGERVPLGYLPAGSWIALSSWIKLDVQPAAFCGRLKEPVSLEVVRSTEEAEANLIVTDLAAWVDYAEQAAEIRLRPLAFAMADDGRVLVRGRPLPPLSGQRYVETQGVAVRCGWRIAPQVDASVLRECLEMAAGDVALFNADGSGADGSWELIADEHFVKATRSAARVSREHVHDR